MHSDERVRVRNCVLKFKSICYEKEIIARELRQKYLNSWGMESIGVSDLEQKLWKLGSNHVRQ